MVGYASDEYKDVKRGEPLPSDAPAPPADRFFMA